MHNTGSMGARDNIFGNGTLSLNPTRQFMAANVQEGAQQVHCRCLRYCTDTSADADLLLEERRFMLKA